MTALDKLDLSLKLSKEEEAEQLEAAQERLLALRLKLGGLTAPKLGPPLRFAPALPGWGGMAVLDRSWYGRVLVERVEGFATKAEWSRAYDEIDAFEKSLCDDGMILVKFWMHLSDEEQLKRFKAREKDPLKSWKLTDEDWRNRSKRSEYEAAIEDMVERTSTKYAPWHLVEGESKRYARVKVVETVIAAIEARL
jgi:polyphosphate kinase 2 (PPK2 family)